MTVCRPVPERIRGFHQPIRKFSSRENCFSRFPPRGASVLNGWVGSVAEVRARILEEAARFGPSTLQHDAPAGGAAFSLGDHGSLVVDGGPFAPEQVAALEALAVQGALALTNCQLQAQLAQTAKLAAVGQLAAGVAHELNSPLGALMMVLESLQARVDESLTGRVDTALRSGHKLQRIVDKLLRYSRAESSALTTLSPAEVVKDTLEMVGTYLNKEGIAVEVEVPSELQVVSNANELQQVLTNLLLNARDALRDAPVRRIRISASEGALVVADTGPGVPPEARSRLFQPFYTTKPVGEGTGLGLSLSRDIATRHGGTLELVPSSEGAAFRLTLPSA